MRASGVIAIVLTACAGGAADERPAPAPAPSRDARVDPGAAPADAAAAQNGPDAEISRVEGGLAPDPLAALSQDRDAWRDGGSYVSIGRPFVDAGAETRGVGAGRGGGGASGSTWPQVDGGAVAVVDGGALGRGLSPEQVRRVVLRHTAALRACYEARARVRPELKGQVTLAWEIAPSGDVTAASVHGTTLNDAETEQCLVRQVKSWKFPVTERDTRVDAYPFKFAVGAPK